MNKGWARNLVAPVNCNPFVLIDGFHYFSKSEIRWTKQYITGKKKGVVKNIILDEINVVLEVWNISF